MPRAGETDRWPPKTNEMPDLSRLDTKLSLNVALNATLRAAGPLDRNARALWLNYVRLVDQLIWEYEAARHALQNFVDTPNNTLSPLFRAIAHMETLVNTMRRAIFFARRMRRHKDSPKIEKLNVLSGSAGDRLVEIRNAIEHLENKILKGKIAQGEPTTLLVQSDRLELLGHEILYRELADWAVELHDLAIELADYRDPARST